MAALAPSGAGAAASGLNADLKRAAAPGSSGGGADGGGDGKRQRLGGTQGAPSGGVDPLDAPMHLLHVRGIPECAPLPPPLLLPLLLLLAPSPCAASPCSPAGRCVPAALRSPHTPTASLCPCRSWANEGFLGVKLGDLVCGRMKWVLISNYM